MSFYTQLKILSFERCAFAQILTTANYHYELSNYGYGLFGKAPKNGGVLEIGFVEQNPLVLTDKNGNETVIGENSLFVIPPESSFSVRSVKSGLHRHTTAEFLICCEKKEVDSFSVPDEKSFVLPLVIPPTPNAGEIFRLIRDIVRAKTIQQDRGYFEECAEFMLLIHKLVQLVQSESAEKNHPPANKLYCDRAKTYISEHIDKPLTVSEVAEETGISKNYLTNVFSVTEGVSLIEYINRRKLTYMLELIRRYDYTVAQAGEHVGFTDANYISRIFKRYYGMTLTQYKANKGFVK